MKLKNKNLQDVSLVAVETRSRRKMFRVDVGQWQAGFIEKWPDTLDEENPWKAFCNLGLRCQYLSSFFVADGGFEAAVACVVDRGL